MIGVLIELIGYFTIIETVFLISMFLGLYYIKKKFFKLLVKSMRGSDKQYNAGKDLGLHLELFLISVLLLPPLLP